MSNMVDEITERKTEEKMYNRLMQAGRKSEGKTALVLSGGGSRGAYQVGCWKALNELGFTFDMVVGVSVGALNGGMVAQGEQALAEELWRKVEADNVFQVEAGAQPVDYALEAVKQGGVSSAPLQRLANKYLPEDVIRNSPMDFGLLTIEIPAYKPHFLWKEDIPAGHLADFVVASATVFPGIKPKVIDGVSYIDGGSYNVMPIHMAVERGATKVIAIYLKAIGRWEPAKELSCCDDITLIQPNFDLGSFLVFDRANSSRLLRLGYMDTMKAFGVYDGKYYSFIKGSFDQKTTKGADAAAHIFNLDPLVLYRRDHFMKILSTVVQVENKKQEKEVANLREYASLSGALKRQNLFWTPEETKARFKDLVNLSSKEAVALFMAKDIKEKGDKSIFSSPYLPAPLKEQRLAARFLIKMDLI